MPPYKQLTQEDVDHFLHHGYIKIPACFTQSQADAVTANLWTRLGMDPHDKTTWTTERTNMPFHTSFSAATFAPKAWAAICDLLGGEDKISPEFAEWRDALIVNLGTAEQEQEGVPETEEQRQESMRNLEGWHVDGDFFVHFLDSAEQGLLVIPLFTDIVSGGGGTAICPEGIAKVAKHLEKHPEGVSPRMSLKRDPEFAREKDLRWFCEVARSCSGFVEATGKVGDVYLLHPLMLHSASKNPLRRVRVITNPPVSLRENFNFDREDGNYSLVERKTLNALGKDRLAGWKIKGGRQRIVPERVRIMEEMKKKELERLEKLKGVQVSEQEIVA
ncbi:hypothetical protein M501DRAFT_940996 [Patellaria atrata CBS 101060]|uniref:Phytanoyl-CoA dioxygenase n=1 Tax=Patellaria atrata CBS 101060 TaxID=1346257 RepID=A0A9P4S5Y2_9PEZI|nr:hypothetical protein M501DRAFT_940996 [Patellaria atrata CBS 101060]